MSASPNQRRALGTIATEPDSRRRYVPLVVGVVAVIALFGLLALRSKSESRKPPPDGVAEHEEAPTLEAPLPSPPAPRPAVVKSDWVLSSRLTPRSLGDDASFELAEQSTALVVVPGGTGSATLIGCSRDGVALFLTNHHVVRRTAATFHQDVSLIIADPRRNGTSVSLAGHTVFAEVGTDLALIEASLVSAPELNGLRILTLRDHAVPKVRVGIPMPDEWARTVPRAVGITAGFPGGGFDGATNSQVTVYEARIFPELLGNAMPNDVPKAAFAGNVRPGNSGGPLIDPDGFLIGIVSEQFVGESGMSRMDMAIPARVVIAFLERHHLGYDPALPARVFPKERPQDKVVLAPRASSGGQSRVTPPDAPFSVVMIDGYGCIDEPNDIKARRCMGTAPNGDEFAVTWSTLVRVPGHEVVSAAFGAIGGIQQAFGLKTGGTRRPATVMSENGTALLAQSEVAPLPDGRTLTVTVAFLGGMYVQLVAASRDPAAGSAFVDSLVLR